MRKGELDRDTALAVLEELRAPDLECHAHEALLDRIGALRKDLTAYDAARVALAEAPDAVLWTYDGRLARTPGTEERIELVRG